MNDIPPELALLIFSTFLAAGLVKGVTGMGLPTIAMGLLVTAMAPVAAATILIVPSFVTNVWQLATGPNAVGLIRRLWLMMTGIVLGTVLGSALLTMVDRAWSGLGLGIALIAYAGYALLSPSFSVAACCSPFRLRICSASTHKARLNPTCAQALTESRGHGNWRAR
jgi:uncharacterized membrane protein YfcA